MPICFGDSSSDNEVSMPQGTTNIFYGHVLRVVVFQYRDWPMPKVLDMLKDKRVNQWFANPSFEGYELTSKPPNLMYSQLIRDFGWGCMHGVSCYKIAHISHMYIAYFEQI